MEIKDDKIEEYINDYLNGLPKDWRSDLDFKIALKTAMIESLSYPEMYVNGFYEKLLEDKFIMNIRNSLSNAEARRIILTKIKK
jgi:hypothetical protein